MVLGSPEGDTLRRIMEEIDSTELLTKLAYSRDARPVRRLAVEKLATAMSSWRPKVNGWEELAYYPVSRLPSSSYVRHCLPLSTTLVNYTKLCA